MAEKTDSKPTEVKYTREQLAKSGKWSVDLVNAVLSDGEYTIAEADKRINGFLKKEV